MKLIVSAKGLHQDKEKELIEAAHQFCPYSKATRGNIEVELEIVH